MSTDGEKRALSCVCELYVSFVTYCGKLMDNLSLNYKANK
jgi:hypothetical protein